MDINDFNQNEKMNKLKEELLAIEEARTNGDVGLSMQEAFKEWDEVIEKECK